MSVLAALNRLKETENEIYEAKHRLDVLRRVSGKI